MGFDFKRTKQSAVCQIVLGSLCFIFGVFDRIFIYSRYHGSYAFHTEGVVAIWTGVWFLITGVFGYFASKPYPSTQRPKMAMINTYLGFSIVATVFAGVLLICYGIGVSYITRSRPSCTRYESKCDYYPIYRCHQEKVTDIKCRTSVGLGAMIIIFAIFEFGVGIWSSICCCMGYNGCCCDTSTPQRMGQVVYVQTQGGPVATYVMHQGPNGMPVAVPAMTGGPVYPVPNQAVGGQGYMMQNRPQSATAVTPTQYAQGDVTTSGVQQPSVKKTDTSREPPPVYLP